MMSGDVVEMDDPSTWPAEVVDWVQAKAVALRDSTTFTSDLQVDMESEDEFRALLAGRLVRAFHATRLFDHEADDILHTAGLQMLTSELCEKKVASAIEHGCIAPALGDRLRTAHVFNDHHSDYENRENRVCLLAPRSLMNRPRGLHGIRPLMRWWGGEAFTMATAGSSMKDHLRIGVPSLVVVDVDLSMSWRLVQCFPSLQKVFIGVELGLEDPAADIHYKSSGIPSHQVANIWQPGHSEYERHPGLRRD